MAMRSTYVIVMCLMVTVAVAVAAAMVLQGEPQKDPAQLPVTISTKTKVAIEFVYPKRRRHILRPAVKLLEYDPCELNSDGVEYDCSREECPTFPRADGTIRRCMCNGPNRPVRHMSATECLDPYLYTDVYGESIVPIEWSDVYDPSIVSIEWSDGYDPSIASIVDRPDEDESIVSIVGRPDEDEERPVNTEEEDDPCNLNSDGVEYDCSNEDCPTLVRADGTTRRCMCNGPNRPVGHMSATECLDPYLYTDVYGASIVPIGWSNQV